MSQRMEALAIANAARSRAARQRRALAQMPPSVLFPALVHPTPGLASHTIHALFATRSGTAKRLVFGIGPSRLERALKQLERDFPRGRKWHSNLRLGELSEQERRRLVKEILVQAPKRGLR